MAATANADADVSVRIAALEGKLQQEKGTGFAYFSTYTYASFAAGGDKYKKIAKTATKTSASAPKDAEDASLIPRSSGPLKIRKHMLLENDGVSRAAGTYVVARQAPDCILN